MRRLKRTWKNRLTQFREEGRAVGGPAAGAAHPLRHRDAARKSATAPASRTIPAISTARQPGEPPFTLMDYFPKDFLVIHRRIPRHRARRFAAMYNGDYARKRTLVDYGFRLPAAFDNRPLKFDEFEERIGIRPSIVSATPGPYEMQRCPAGGGTDHPAHRAAGSGDHRASGGRARWTT